AVPGRGWAAAVPALASAQAVVRGPSVASAAPISLIAVAVDTISAAMDMVDTTSHGTVSASRSRASATATLIATNGGQPHTAGSGSTSATATTTDRLSLARQKSALSACGTAASLPGNHLMFSAQTASAQPPRPRP